MYDFISIQRANRSHLIHVKIISIFSLLSSTKLIKNATITKLAKREFNKQLFDETVFHLMNKTHKKAIINITCNDEYHIIYDTKSII